MKKTTGLIFSALLIGLCWGSGANAQTVIDPGCDPLALSSNVSFILGPAGEPPVEVVFVGEIPDGESTTALRQTRLSGGIVPPPGPGQPPLIIPIELTAMSLVSTGPVAFDGTDYLVELRSPGTTGTYEIFSTLSGIFFKGLFPAWPFLVTFTNPDDPADTETEAFTRDFVFSGTLAELPLPNDAHGGPCPPGGFFLEAASGFSPESDTFSYGSTIVSPITATKTDELTGDGNGDGIANTGDQVTYTSVIENTGSSAATETVFDDTLADTFLATDPLVTTSGGTIIEGNVPGGTLVEIEFGDLDLLDFFDIEYVVEIDTPPAEPLTEVSNQGIVTGKVDHPFLGLIPFSTVTDDPDTAELGDPTIFTVVGGRGRGQRLLQRFVMAVRRRSPVLQANDILNRYAGTGCDPRLRGRRSDRRVGR